MNWKTNLLANYTALRARLQLACESANRDAQDVLIIWVSKTNPIEAVEAATDVGLDSGLARVDFGENKIQECVQKFSEAHPHRQLHIIGPIQSNKLRKAVVLGDWIHTVSSAKQLFQLERIAQEENRQVKVLFQVNTSGENSKSGFLPSDIVDFLDSLPKTHNLLYSGLMTIGVNSGVPEDSRAGFTLLRTWRDQFVNKDERFTHFKQLSMGMTADLEVAIDEGATMIRVGTALFGQRNYGESQ